MAPPLQFWTLRHSVCLSATLAFATHCKSGLKGLADMSASVQLYVQNAGTLMGQDS